MPENLAEGPGDPGETQTQSEQEQEEPERGQGQEGLGGLFLGGAKASKGYRLVVGGPERNGEEGTQHRCSSLRVQARAEFSRAHESHEVKNTFVEVQAVQDAFVLIQTRLARRLSDFVLAGRRHPHTIAQKFIRWRYAGLQ